MKQKTTNLLNRRWMQGLFLLVCVGILAGCPSRKQQIKSDRTQNQAVDSNQPPSPHARNAKEPPPPGGVFGGMGEKSGSDWGPSKKTPPSKAPDFLGKPAPNQPPPNPKMAPPHKDPTAKLKPLISGRVAPSRNCSNISEAYGYSPTDPIEPGRDGMRMGSRIVWRCPNGAVARMVRVGNIGRAKYRSRGRLIPGGLDVVDRWRVKCPKMRAREVYVNAYRVGHGCAAAPFSVVPKQALKLIRVSVRMLRQRQLRTAMMLAQRATQISGELDLFLQVKGMIFFAAKRYRAAIAMLKRAVRMNRFYHPNRLLLLGFSYQRIGKIRQFEAVLNFLLRTLSPRSKYMGSTVCYKAALFSKRKQTAKAYTAAKVACLRYRRCCGLFKKLSVSREEY